VLEGWPAPGLGWGVCGGPPSAPGVAGGWLAGGWVAGGCAGVTGCGKRRSGGSLAGSAGARPVVAGTGLGSVGGLTSADEAIGAGAAWASAGFGAGFGFTLGLTLGFGFGAAARARTPVSFVRATFGATAGAATTGACRTWLRAGSGADGAGTSRRTGCTGRTGCTSCTGCTWCTSE
jgi:hypothetical protein